MHEQRSHRDLKAGNVMVSGWDSADGVRIHLIDWANSRRHDEGEQKTSASQVPCNFRSLNLTLHFQVFDRNRAHGCGVLWVASLSMLRVRGQTGYFTVNLHGRASAAPKYS